MLYTDTNDKIYFVFKIPQKKNFVTLSQGSIYIVLVQKLVPPPEEPELLNSNPRGGGVSQRTRKLDNVLQLQDCSRGPVIIYLFI